MPEMNYDLPGLGEEDYSGQIQLTLYWDAHLRGVGTDVNNQNQK